MALYPLPEGAAGDRLRRLMRMETTEYLRKFDRANLLPPDVEWSSISARIAAHKLRNTYRILLGTRVAAAHGVQFDPFEAYEVAYGSNDRPGVVLVMPHPSGRNRMWNDKLNVERCWHAVADFLQLIEERKQDG